MPDLPDTIVLIHGLWMTPLSWEGWIDRYTKRGYWVIAPAWPGMERGTDEIRADLRPLEHVDMHDFVDYHEAIIGELEAPPIIMGHSFGGVVTEILLGRGFGAAGVSIDRAAAIANTMGEDQSSRTQTHKHERAPLLLIAGSEDRSAPASADRAVAEKYRRASPAITDFKEFPGRSHFIVCQEGWEDVADYALDWAVRNARMGASV